MRNFSYESAVFIAGHRRSGTTLLMNLLEGHPQLCVFPADSGFFYAYYPQYESSQYSNDDRIKRIIEFCYGNLREEVDKVNRENPQEPPLEFPFNKLYHTFEERATGGTFTTKEMLLAMISSYREVFTNNKETHVRWVEKSTTSEVYARYMFEWFPNARMIHVIRDPRDNYSSLRAGWDDRYKERADDIRRLLQSMIERGRLGLEFAKYNVRRYGDRRYFVVKYEELVTQPETIMKRISEFLEIEYNEVLLMPTVCGRQWRGNNFKGTEFLKPSDQNVGRWRERITPEEARLIEFHFRDSLEFFGYKTAFDVNECLDAATDHYKWHNYSQKYTV